MNHKQAIPFLMSVFLLLFFAAPAVAQQSQGQGKGKGRDKQEVTKKKTTEQGADETAEGQEETVQELKSTDPNGNAYGKNKVDLKGREFGQARADEARSRKMVGAADSTSGKAPGELPKDKVKRKVQMASENMKKTPLTGKEKEEKENKQN